MSDFAKGNQNCLVALAASWVHQQSRANAGRFQGQITEQARDLKKLDILVCPDDSEAPLLPHSGATMRLRAS